MTKRACRIIPELRKGTVVQKWSGVRPMRRGGVRLELEGNSTVHNYGHGGSGILTSWGCAERVVELAAQTLFTAGARL